MTSQGATLLEFETRASSSPFVDCVWRSRSRAGGRFLSMAEASIELVMTRLPGFLAATLRGPVTRGSFIECPDDGEWLAIRFRLGTYFPRIPTAELIDHQDLHLALLGNGKVLLSGLSWELPTFENAEDFVARLALCGAIARSHATDAAAEGDIAWMSQRSLQRHFRRVTGMTLTGYEQVQRARWAADLLRSGTPILDTTFAAGYFDQAHLTRAVKHLIGMTPARLLRDRPQLSFSYKTTVP
jgi:AraC-like DNA-binding protein